LPSPPVLITWIGTRTDPYVRGEDGLTFKQGPNGLIPGPTLTLLTDPESSYAGRIKDIVVLRQKGREPEKHDRIYEELVTALAEHAPDVQLHPETWTHDDPTDHAVIYDWLRSLLPRVRRRFRGRELVVHLSPGTAAMHTVWVLMAETGFIAEPFTAVQSLRAHQRRGRAAVLPLDLGVDTFFKRWQETRPGSETSAPRAIRWDPRQFRSNKLRALYDDARRVARLRVPVLILGERGTGKTTLASWIRFRSPFRKPELDGAWPAVPCGQYTPQTMRSELFGHVKGAFTDAKKDKPGLLARADKDTLFLDEVGDISRDLQRLLIKVLEEGTYQPLGSDGTSRTDVRLLTATNLPPDLLAERLDADFLDRISPFTLRVPALREIPEELEWLWPTVLEEAAQRSRAPARYATMGARHRARVLRALRAHPLPGNVRDLFRVAWHFLAARSDDDAPMTVAEAVEYAVGVLDGGAGQAGFARSAVLARAFADRRSMDPAWLEDGPLDPELAISEFKGWFGHEAPNLAAAVEQPVGEVVTVSERTLRNWRRNEPADQAE